jgi:hypothetical protein
LIGGDNPKQAFLGVAVVALGLPVYLFLFRNKRLVERRTTSMTWIKTVAVDESEEVRKAVESQRELYPIEYATPVHPTPTARLPASSLLTV